MPHSRARDLPSKSRYRDARGPHIFIKGLLWSCLLLASTVFAPSALAHAEYGKPLCASDKGVDVGRCNDPDQPCKSIGYASSKANKGDQMQLAAGHYSIDDADSLFYLLSDLVPVSGGYSRADRYAKTSAKNITHLSGVPLEYAEQLASKGFSVIVDSKGQNKSQRDNLQKALGIYRRLKQAQSATPCVDGFAGDHACDKIDLLAHLPLSSFSSNPSAANDIWGFYDLNDGREYALIGLENGVGVVEVSDPESPRIVTVINGESTKWRDLKHYQRFNTDSGRWDNYAYVTADYADVGTMIIDLRDLPNTATLLSIHKDLDIAAHNVYLSNVDYSLGVPLNGVEPYLHIVGSNDQQGAFKSYALNDPTSLSEVYRTAANSRSNYSHDASSMVVTDPRKDSQCVATGPVCEILFDFNENDFQIWDKTQNSTPTRLSTTTYPEAEYVHSGWYTEDKQVLVVHDELDEQNRSLNTSVRFFELSDLRVPTLLSTWVGTTAAIDHNGFVRGNRYYMSHYTRGMTVLDISDSANPQTIGHFDTFPPNDNNGFNGAWGIYPYLPSGNLLVSDIVGGLYVLRDNTLDPAEGNARFTQGTYAVVEGETARISVVRSDGDRGAVSVKWELLAGATDNDDLSMDSGVLSWADGDDQSQEILIPINTNDGDEHQESFFIRLYDPRGSLALAAPNIAVISIAPSQLTADAGVDVAMPKDTLVRLQGAGSAPYNDELSYRWQQTSGASVTLQQADSANAQFTAPNTFETLAFQLTVTDRNDADATDTVSIAAHQDPVVDAGSDISAASGNVVTLQGSASASGTGELNYRWQQTSGTTVTLQQADSASAQFTVPSASGTLVFELTVTDDAGASSSDTVSVTVQAPAPRKGGGGASGYLLLLTLALYLTRRRANGKRPRYASTERKR